jgi:hypothetical protein
MFSYPLFALSLLLVASDIRVLAETTLKLTPHSVHRGDALSRLTSHHPLSSRDIGHEVLEGGRGDDSDSVESSVSAASIQSLTRSRLRRQTAASGSNDKPTTSEQIEPSTAQPHLPLNSQDSGGVAFTIELEVGNTPMDVLVSQINSNDVPCRTLTYARLILDHHRCGWHQRAVLGV